MAIQAMPKKRPKPQMAMRDVSVADGYSRWAKDYDSYPNALIAIEQDRVRALLGEVKGKRVLDAACGTGRHALWLHEAGASVVGLDASEAMLSLARAKNPGIDWRTGSIATSSLGGFDLVLCALMAEHERDLGGLLRALCGAIAPNGALVLSVWHPFMIMKGVATHYEDGDAGVEYVLPSFAHLPSAYVTHLQSLGFSIEVMEEPVVDDALIAVLPHMEKHRGFPLALILRASREHR